MARDRRSCRHLVAVPIGASRVRAALACLGVLAVLVGCAGGQPPGTRPQGYSAWQAVTTCIRENGMPDWPDPVVGPDGQLGFPSDAPRTSEHVQQACGSEFAALPASGTATAAPTSAADLTRLLAYARCLRLTGYPGWPDPGPDGRFPPSVLSSVPDVKRLLVHPPAACRGLVPAGGIHVAA
jgi:hypothetical protein